MISAPRGRVRAAATHAVNNRVVGHINFKHEINFYAGLFHGFGLWNGAGKSVKQITICTIGFFQALFHQIDDDFVGHQAATVHDFFCFDTQGGAGFNSCAQHVASGNLGNAKLFLDECRLRAFASTGRSQ